MGLLEASQRKVARAETHIRDLEREIGIYHGSGPYERVIEVDPNDPSKCFHKFKLTKPMPSVLDCIMSDAVHNLRDALDVAGYAIAIATGKTNPLHTAFPFAPSAERFEEVIQGRCKDLPDEIRSVFRTYKPYRGGNDFLWALNYIGVHSKHTMLAPLGSVYESGDMSVVGKTFVEIPVNPVWDRAKNEVIFARFSTGVEIHYHFGFTFLVAFDQTPVVGGEPVLGILDYFTGLVEHILSSLEAECQRLGIA